MFNKVDQSIQVEEPVENTKTQEETKTKSVLEAENLANQIIISEKSISIQLEKQPEVSII